MKVRARRYAWCIECGHDTIQWIVEAPQPKRGSWGTRKPAVYKCQDCGAENYA